MSAEDELNDSAQLDDENDNVGLFGSESEQSGSESESESESDQEKEDQAQVRALLIVHNLSNATLSILQFTMYMCEQDTGIPSLSADDQEQVENDLFGADSEDEAPTSRRKPALSASPEPVEETQQRACVQLDLLSEFTMIFSLP